ncbi:MAG: CapA family protein, partial [Terriglobia bacterium]
MSQAVRRVFEKATVRIFLVVFLIVLPCVLVLPLLGQDQGSAAQGFSITLAGDSIVMTPARARRKDPRFMAVVKVVREADAAFTNLELTFPGADAYPAGGPRAMWVASDPERLKELQWIGFNLFGAANNHSLDYGVGGLLDTIQVLKQDGA